jgi:hypothetical protein
VDSQTHHTTIINSGLSLPDSLQLEFSDEWERGRQ